MGRSAHPITRYTVEVSDDWKRWTTVTSGLWADDDAVKTASFRPVTAGWVRVTSRQAGHVGVGEVALVASRRSAQAAASESQQHRRAPSQGRWSDPIGLPIVPTTAVLLPHGKVLTMSAYTDTEYDLTSTMTQVSILDVDAKQAGSPRWRTPITRCSAPGCPSCPTDGF